MCQLIGRNYAINHECVSPPPPQFFINTASSNMTRSGAFTDKFMQMLANENGSAFAGIYLHKISLGLLAALVVLCKNKGVSDRDTGAADERVKGENRKARGEGKA